MNKNENKANTLDLDWLFILENIYHKILLLKIRIFIY